jgi:hypothetical protein
MTTTALDANGFAETDGALIVYNYVQETGEYTKSATVFLAKGVGIPANSTVIAPNDNKTGYAQIFNPTTKIWSYVEDHRGQVVYNISNGAPFTVTALGSIDDTTYTVEKPPAPIVTLKEQATAVQAWIQQQANLAAAMGEVFTADMKDYVKAINAIASGADTTSTALPARPTDILTS